MYQLSDKIGCMSPNNLEYLLKHNDCITEKNVEVFPNAINPINNSNNYDSKKHSVRKIYNIANDKTVFLYGGNLGKPQGINYISKVIKNFRKIEDAFLLIVGSGTEFDFIDRQISETGNPNIKLIEKLKKEEYDNLLSSVDIGLIFLDHRFTIPNFPSRLTSYLEHSLPIIAATDLYSDLGKIIENNKVGFWCESKGISDFLQIANILAKDKDLRIKMGQNGRKLLEEEYDITKTIEIILKHI